MRLYRRAEALIDSFALPRTTPPKKYFLYLWMIIKEYRRILIICAVTSFFVALGEVLVANYAAHLIDVLTTTTPEAFFETYALELILVIVFLVVLRPAMIVANALALFHSLVVNMNTGAKWQAHRHLMTQPVSFFQNDFAGRLSNRVMQIGRNVENTISMAFEAIWFFLIYVLLSIILFSMVDWRLGMIAAIWLALFIAVDIIQGQHIAEASEKLSNASSWVSANIVDSYANIETVKLFSSHAREEKRSLFVFKRFRLRFSRLMARLSFQSLILAFLTGLILIAANGFALHLWRNGEASLGDVVLVIGLTMRFSAMAGWVMWVTIEMFEGAGAIMESLESISVEPTMKDVASPQPFVVTAGIVEFENVSHHYGKDEGGLSHLSLHIPNGQKLAIVGRSGAGKSTLAKLLIRFMDPESGRILIDNQDIALVAQDDLRAEIGMVTQEPSLMHRSIRDNIRLARPDASEAEVIAAAKKAHAHEFIMDLQDPKGRTGYNAFTGERGVQLSGGQRQRIALARVILKNAPILILDEATSALDSEVEAAIQDDLLTLIEGKTVIAIAHRLSTISSMDRIIVLDKGEIAEDGTHQSLLEDHGIYAELWNRQSGGFLAQD